jgi:hypothetical protein
MFESVFSLRTLGFSMLIGIECELLISALSSCPGKSEINIYCAFWRDNRKTRDAAAQKFDLAK